MKKRLSLLTLSTLFLGISLEACSSLKCGDGTKEVGGVCLADDANGNGGGGGEVNPGPSIEFDGVLAAGPASETSILVTWIPVDDPDVTYNIYVATKSGGYNLAAPQAEAPEGSSSYEVTVAEKGEYFVVVYAVLGGEVIVNKAEASVKTEADKAAPAFTGAKSAGTVDGSSVKLGWEAAKDDLSPAGALLYFVYVGESEDLIDLDVPLGVSSPGATSITVHLPAPDKQYFFVVRVRDAAGNLDDNTKVVKAKSGPDVEAPRFSGCTSVVAKSASALAVSWEKASDDTTLQDEIKYRVFVSKKPGEQNFGSPSAEIVGASSGLVEGLDKSTKYYVVCRAVDAAGNADDNTRSQSATTKSDGEPPIFAGLTSVDNVGSTTVDLVWDAATDNQTKPEEIIYDVFVALSSGAQDFEAAPLASSAPGATSMTLTGLTSRKTNYVVVRARDAALNYSETIVEKSFTTKVSLFNDIEVPIYSVKCAISGCHTGISPTGNLNLSATTSWGNSVGVVAQSYPDETRIIPFDSVNSHLVKRVKSTGQVGEPQKMPLTGDALTSDEIATLEAWINEGALNN